MLCKHSRLPEPLSSAGQLGTRRFLIITKNRGHLMSYRQKVFLKEFNKDEFAKFRTTYELINPDRPIETANVKYEDTDPRFRKFLEGIDDSKRSFVDEILPHLGLFLHGPFPLPGKRVTTSAWDCRGKFGAYEAAGVLPKLAGSRVLDIGCNAGYDTFLMSSLGAIEAVGLEPYGFYHQACFLNAVYDMPGVSFMNLGWEDLDPRYFGGFDFVNCQGLIYHVKEPMLLIEKLASIMRPGATLLMETHVLSEASTQSQFIEGAFWGDETYWWIFGAECLMGMLRSGGFKDVRMPLKADCDSRNPLNPRVTVEGYPAGARAWFVATRS
jgi:tRNA (mo5U34)-methyltransferase